MSDVRRGAYPANRVKLVEDFIDTNFRIRIQIRAKALRQLLDRIPGGLAL